MYSSIGKAKNMDRDIIFEVSDNDIVTGRSDDQLSPVDGSLGRNIITDFISKTVMYGDGSSMRFNFQAPEEKSVQSFLQSHFGIKDQSVVHLFEYFESVAACDSAKFMYCRQIIEWRGLNDFPKRILTRPFDTYALVRGIFDIPGEKETVEKIFLQVITTKKIKKVKEPAITLAHQELTVELFYLAQRFEMLKYF